MVKRDANFNPLGGRRGVRRNQGHQADWQAADGDALRRAIERASIVGGALRFGYSRDGGAYAIGIYGDGEPYTEFVRPDEDINQFLESLVDLYESIGDDRTSAPEPKKEVKKAT